MKVGIPELFPSLRLEPSHTNEQAEGNTSPQILARCLLGGLDYTGGDHAAVRAGNDIFLKLAGNDLLDLVSQPESDLGHLL